MAAVTHAVWRIAESLSLRARGYSARTIADLLGIPRSTVSAWISGRFPDAWISRNQRCTVCGGWAHRFEEIPPSYLYLLGLYLGDGSISSHPRGVYRLRLTLDAAYPGIIDEAVSTMRQVRPVNRVNTWARPS
jgi:Homeodomain-like domain